MDLNLNILLLAQDARSYYDAYEVLKETKLPHASNSMSLATPAMVCLAFSTELHVKLLLRTFDLEVTGHDIKKLFMQLPKDERTKISTDEFFHPTQQRKYFFEEIEQASNLFVRTRYYFENMGTLQFNIGFCATLCRVIQKRIVKRVPYLASDLGIAIK